MAGEAGLPAHPSPGWELVLVPPPPVRSGPELRAVVLLVSESPREVRQFTAITGREPLEVVVSAGCLAPMQGRPGRPRWLRVVDAAVASELAGWAREQGVELRIVAQVPAAMAVLTEFMAAEGAPQAPGLSEELPAWREHLASLAARRPWERVPDAVRFHLSGPGLEGAIAVVIGAGGENRGVVLFAGKTDLDRFEEVRHTGQIREISTLSVLLEPASELSDAEVRACRAANLAFGALYAKAYAVCEGRFRAPTGPEGERLRLAVGAVLAVSDADLARLARTPGTVVEARSSGGVAVVARSPLPPFAPIAHHLHLLAPASGGVATVVVRAGKADAKKLVGVARGVLSLELTEGADGGVTLLARFADGCRNLIEAPPGAGAQALRGLLAHSTCRLAVCARAGASVRVVETDLIWTASLPIVAGA